jgi:tetratricopeptide (TPR) repeat protein
VSERWQALAVDEIGGYADEGRPRWHMVRSVLGVEAFGVNAWRATEPGQELIGEHDELGEGAGGHEELYVVLSGHATFTVDGEAVEAPARTVVFVKEPSVRRSAVARDAGTTVLVVGARVGEPFAVSDWERSAEALRYWSSGEWDRALEVLERQHEEHPDNAGVLYNLACVEAKVGRGDSAIEHLAAAVALEPRFAAHAQTDADLDAVRDDPRFPPA